jgi:poly(hydroxyalkanoate) depolymerase family esterase
MNTQSKIDMIEATRLTRQGRLNEAMAVLMRTLPSGTASSFGGGPNPWVRAPADMLPPLSPAAHFKNASFADHRLRSHEALRGFLGRWGDFGSRGRLGEHDTSSASIPVPEGAEFDERVYANAAGRRAYKIFVPSGCKGQAVPLVVMLHGCNQSPNDFAAGTRMNELAEEQTFLVAYPAQDRSANPSRCWNWFNTDDQQRDQGEPLLIAGITRQIMRDFPVESGRVYIAGLSAGGAAAAVMGATYPDLYAAVGVHSGLACGAARDIPSAFAAMRGGSPGSRDQGESAVAIPTIVFHGDRDRTVNPVNGDQVITQAKSKVALRTKTRRGETPDGMTYTCTIHANENGHPILEQWILHGGSHAWSGGSAAGSFTEPRGPDASREMVRFFLQQPTKSS